MKDSKSGEMYRMLQRIKNTDLVQSECLGKGSWRKWLFLTTFLPISNQTFKYFITHDLPLLSELYWWGNYFYLGWLPIVGTQNCTKISVLLWKRQLIYAYFSASEKQFTSNSFKFTALRDWIWLRTKGSCFLSGAKTAIHKTSQCLIS